MLNQKEFDHWCAVNNISKDTRTIIEEIRRSEPSRRVQSGGYSVSGTFPSRKMGATIQFESGKNELSFVYKFEHDPDVLEYYDQPPSFKISYLTGKNHKWNGLHTPDFFVIKRDRAFWVECKTEDELLTLVVKKPNRFQLTEDGQWIFPPGQEYAANFDLDYEVRSSKEINRIYQRNIEFLDDYYRSDTLEISEEANCVIRKIVKNEPGITLKKLLEEIQSQESVSADDIYSLIATDEICIDLETQLLTEPQTAKLFGSREVFQAYSNVLLLTNHQNESIVGARAVELSPNKEILWDGKVWKIVNVGESDISLINENKDISSFPINILERLVVEGKIKGIFSSSEDENHKQINEMLINAKDADLNAANYKVAIVRSALAGEEIPHEISERTLRDWKAKYRDAENIFGNGYFGLLPQPGKGNRRMKLPPLSIELLEKAVTDDYETLEQKSCLVVHLAYEAECKKQNITPASYVTLCNYVKKRSKYEQTLKRKGKRAAYKYEEFYWNLDDNTPRHGERPFHIAHIDHTELDIELVDSVTGENLGRPWLTLLVDAYTRRILAVYLTFNSPSKISCMMALRECVRRYGRLPQILVVDGGKEFASVYFETLLACYEITKKTRPPAKSRFGLVVERLFGTTNTQFVHNLKGNTQIMKDVRQVTTSNNPKNRAIWTLSTFYVRLCEWAYNVYDQMEHSTLNQTPQEAFARGMSVSGNRSRRLITFNDDFRLITLPSTIKGTAKVDHTRGVKINKIFYWSEEFKHPEVPGTRVPVKYDPYDMSTAYAYVNGRWRKCISQHWRVFRNRSEKEIYLATEELKKKYGKGSVTMAKLAKFLKSVEADEALLKQRRLDREQRSILTLINGGDSVEDNPSVTTHLEFDKSPNSNVVSFPVSEETEETAHETGEKKYNFVVFPTL